MEIAIIHDDALEADETLSVSLTTAETYITLGNTQTEVTITDNRGKLRENIAFSPNVSVWL